MASEPRRTRLAAREWLMWAVVLGGPLFLAVDWFFIKPYGTLHVANPIDLVVLAPFVVSTLLAARLLWLERESARRRESEQLKDTLIASVSHDLRTPLTTIKALAHELGALGDERSQVIEEQADRLTTYVRDLLDLSRLSAGAMPVRIEINAVDDLLTAVVQETEARLDGRRLVVHLPGDGELLTGRFDLAMAVRIVVNLVENAHKYSPREQPVEVVASRTGNLLHIAVLDRGPGLPPNERDAVFEPFYRPSGAPADTGSAGLGLALGRRMAVVMHGTLAWAPRDGGGSAFTLTLPAAVLTLS